MKRWIVWAAVLAAGTGAWLWVASRGGPAEPPYRLGKAERGDLRVAILATGTLQPVTMVQVGTQVTGTVQKLLADYNSRVKAGQVIAQIDPAPYAARVAQDRATLARAEADVERVQASLVQAEKELARTRDLARQEFVSPAEVDQAVANHDSLAAQLKVARASVDLGRAALESAEVNLRYTTIVSPIDGTVISRSVDVGQTVSASLQAPTLFVVADNLGRLQIQASVPEADIGRVAAGQPVSFTVDAYRDAAFKGKVAQVRLSPTTVQNVVTYTVIVDAENPGERLLPGMTATLSFEIERLEGALKVPNAALRFTPPGEAPVRGRGRGRQQQVWIPTPRGPKAVPVVAGPTDGTFTAVLKGELAEGQDVITGTAREEKPAGGLTNPFAPPRGRGGRH